jgi:ElaB/YqjD/DUF883 family membrane-anchored ribosome-binding protein
MTTSIRSQTHENHNHHKARHTEIAAEADGLLDRLSHSAVAEETKELVSRVRGHLQSLKEGAEAAQEQLQESFRATEKKIQQNPWTTVGLTAAAGILLGLLLSRRR